MSSRTEHLPVTTASPEAAACLDRAMASFNHWETDAITHFDAALAADPGFPLGHAAKGLALALARDRKFHPILKSSLAAARAAGGDITAREQHYVQALDAVVAGRPDGLVRCLKAVLADHPTDLFAHRLVQQELFWMGEAGQMCAVVEDAAPSWTPDVPGYPLFLAVRAFSNEEALHFDDAERYGRAAVEADPTDPWGAHAVAHVLEMQRRTDGGIQWLEPLTGNWSTKNQIVHHLWWHLCLFLLEQGDHGRILELYDQNIWNPAAPLMVAMPYNYIDLQNAAAMLLRLELRSVDVGDRWQALTASAEYRIDNDVSPFTSAHAAAVLAANGLFDRAEELLRSMQATADLNDDAIGRGLRRAAIPAARAAIAHRKGDYEAVLTHLLPARHDLRYMGGSHAQRDIFFQLLIDASRRLGRKDEAVTLLQEVAAIGFQQVPKRTLYGTPAA